MSVKVALPIICAFHRVNGMPRVKAHDQNLWSVQCLFRGRASIFVARYF